VRPAAAARPALGVALLCAALALAGGCGGSGGGKSATSGGQAIQVTMQGLRFHPASVTAHVGQAIVWTNADSVDHNVTATSGATFHSRAFGHGTTYRFVPARPGTLRYVCTLHPGMNGSITVLRSSG